MVKSPIETTIITVTVHKVRGDLGHWAYPQKGYKYDLFQRRLYSSVIT